MRSRGFIFALVAGVCVLGGAAFVVAAALRDSSTTSEARVGRAAAIAGPLKLPRTEAVAPRTLVARAVDPRDARLNGQVTSVPLGGGRAKTSRLACQRIYYSEDRGICLALDSSGVGYHATLLGPGLRKTGSFALTGVPSRTRVSPDGRWGSITVFETGHSYAVAGEFSTRTELIDMRQGKAIAQLEDFSVTRDGNEIQAPDFNYWGVTFTRDGKRFFATLATGGKTWLVEGDIAGRRMRTLRSNVECPSLSPDGTRIAYKKRVGGPGEWRLHVLDLATMRDTPLSERRSIDDQAEWLDAGHVIYGDDKSVLSVRADGGGKPTKLLARAASPAVLR